MDHVQLALHRSARPRLGDAAGNAVAGHPDRSDYAERHDAELDHVRPDDRRDAAQHRVRDGDDAEQHHGLLHAVEAWQQVRRHDGREQQRGAVEQRPGAQHHRQYEERRSEQAALEVEARLEVLVGRRQALDAVEERDEQQRHRHGREQVA